MNDGLFGIEQQGVGSGAVQSSAIPIAAVIPFAGDTAPSLWLLCFGQNVSRTTYADLFAIISTTYGVGDGSTTFGIPDLRGRAIAGKDNMGGVSANRLTNQSGGLDGDILGASGGAETHTLTVAELASHAHSLTNGTGVLRNSGGTRQNTITSGSSSYQTLSVVAEGSDSAHNNVQPTFIFNYIIYAGI